VALEQGGAISLSLLRAKESNMKYLVITMSILLGSYSFAVAQGNPSGRGSTTGDPAASSANPSADPNATKGTAPNASGSGTSTSGGRDNSGDQGRDKAPGSDMTVKQRPDKPNIPNPGR
jgi:hypothetical protein